MPGTCILSGNHGYLVSRKFHRHQFTSMEVVHSTNSQVVDTSVCPNDPTIFLLINTPTQTVLPLSSRGGLQLLYFIEIPITHVVAV